MAADRSGTEGLEDAFARARAKHAELGDDEFDAISAAALAVAEGIARDDRELVAVFEAELDRRIEERSVLGAPGSVLPDSSEAAAEIPGALRAGGADEQSAGAERVARGGSLATHDVRASFTTEQTWAAALAENLRRHMPEDSPVAAEKARGRETRAAGAAAADAREARDAGRRAPGATRPPRRRLRPLIARIAEKRLAGGNATALVILVAAMSVIEGGAAVTGTGSPTVAVLETLSEQATLGGSKEAAGRADDAARPPEEAGDGGAPSGTAKGSRKAPPQPPLVQGAPQTPRAGETPQPPLVQGLPPDSNPAEYE